MSTPPEQISQLVALPNPFTGSEYIPVSQNNGAGYNTYKATPQAFGGITPQTTQELAAGVTPAFYQYPPGDIRRYGAATTLADNTAAINTANSIGITLTIPQGVFKFTGNPIITSPLVFSGGVLQPVANISINGAINAPTQQIFNCSLGGTITGRIESPFIYPEWFGATGNGKRGSSGAMLSTAFSDASATFTTADVGKSIFIVPPPYTTWAPVLTTIATYVSSTAVTLAAAPSWASSASYNGTISGTTLTIAGSVTGTVLPGQTVVGAGVTGATTILYQLTGTTGAGGGATYKLSASSTVGSSTAMTGAYYLSYYYGTDDTAAIASANTLVGQLNAALGSTAGYNTIRQTSTLSFTAPNIYLMTAQAVIGNAINTTAARWEGLRGRATLAFGITSSTTDCVLFGAGASTDGSTLCDLIIDCCFSGRDGVVVGGFEAPRLINVEVFNAERNNISITPLAGSFVQQGYFENVQAVNAGLHTIYVYPQGGAFANECRWVTCVTGSPSQRQSGGTAVYFDAITGNFCDTWTFDTTKFTNGWNGDSNFQPLSSPIFVNTGASIFGGSGLKILNCYAEQDGSVLGTSSPAIKVSAGASASIQADGWSAFSWGVDIERSRFDGASIFTVAASASQDVCVLGTGQVWEGEISFYLNDGTNGTYDRRAFTVVPGINGTITALGAVSSPAAVTYTITANASSGSTHITVNNTGAVPLTLQYSALTKHRSGGVGFVY